MSLSVRGFTVSTGNVAINVAKKNVQFVKTTNKKQGDKALGEVPQLVEEMERKRKERNRKRKERMTEL